MRINVDFSELQRLADRFNENKSQFTLAGYKPTADILYVDLKSGVDVNIGEIDTSTGLLSYEGRLQTLSATLY